MSEIILHISAGQGPEECRWVAHQLAAAYAKEAAQAGLTAMVLNDAVEGGGKDLSPSLLLRLDGEAADSFALQREGSVLWVGTSPFRPHHKRRNWFVGVTRVPPLSALIMLRDEDIDYQAMRASGPGGQHVNKTDSAVRATHRPTGLTTTAQEQRSQHANRKLARLKLGLLLAERQTGEEKDARAAGWQRNHDLERGNPVRVYEGPRFKLR